MYRISNGTKHMMAKWGFPAVQFSPNLINPRFGREAPLMSNEMSMLKQVQVADFAIQEVALYLDSHPMNEKAMAYYKTWQSMRKKSGRHV